VRELSGFLSQSQEVRESIARQMFQQLIKQPIAAYGLGEVQDIHRRWAEEGLTTESLARLLVLLSAKNPELRANAAPDQVSLN
jgi:hypothetical protein